MPSEKTGPLDLFLEDCKTVETHCRIVPKAGGLVPLHFNEAQLRVIQRCVDQLKKGLPVRVVVLKARQLGISTLVQSLFFARTASRPGYKGVLISHQDDSKQKIWGMQGVFVRESGMGPYVSSFGKQDGPLRWKHDSMLSCMTAGGKGIGHGETIQAVHYSEKSRYGYNQTIEQQEGVRTMVAGVNAAVAKTPDSMVFIESTAAGVGGEFYEDYWRAKRGESDFAAVFIGWQDEPGYVMAPESVGIADMGDLTSAEEALVEEHGLRLDQVAWRRFTVRNDFQGDERRFREQYPATDHEAFLVSGSPVFDGERISLYLKRAKPPKWEGDIGWSEDNPNGWHLRPGKGGAMQVWEWPSRFYDYVVGADCAECLDTRSDQDYAVVRSSGNRIVAVLRGWWDPGQYARRLAALSWLYRRALLVVEKNAVGTAVVGTLRGKLGGPVLYDRLYRATRVDHATGQKGVVYGWHTTPSSKHVAVEAEQSLLRTGAEHNPCREILEQASVFTHKENGKMEAEAGSRDDGVIAWILTAAVVDRLARPGTVDEVREWRMDRFLEHLGSGEEIHSDLRYAHG